MRDRNGNYVIADVKGKTHRIESKNIITSQKIIDTTKKAIKDGDKKALTQTLKDNKGKFIKPLLVALGLRGLVGLNTAF